MRSIVVETSLIADVGNIDGRLPRVRDERGGCLAAMYVHGFCIGVAGSAGMVKMREHWAVQLKKATIIEPSE